MAAGATAAAATVAAPCGAGPAGPDQHALAEHMAVEGHLPRIRARLRQEGQRHDRRRPQDRGAARRRRGAGIPIARRGLQGRARRRPRRAGLSLRQADRAGAVGLRPGLRRWTPTCCCPGTSTAAARNCSNEIFTSIGANVVSFPYGPMPTQPLGWYKKPITKVDDFKGLKFRTVGISIDVFTGMGAAVNALPGGEIVAAMDRGLLDAAEFNNATSDRILGFADVSKVLHAAELSSECRAVRDFVQQDEIRRAAGQDEGDHRERGRSRFAGHVVEGGRSLLARITSSCRPRTTSRSTRRLTRSSSASSKSSTRSRRRRRRRIRCSRRSSSRSSPSPSGRRSGNKTRWSTARWRSTTTSARTRRSRSDGSLNWQGTIPVGDGMVPCCYQDQPQWGAVINERPRRPSYHRWHQHLGRQGCSPG